MALLSLAIGAIDLWDAQTWAARAADEASGLPDPSIATSLPPELGDPGGIRAQLAGRGVTFGANYIGELFSVASGSVNRDSHYDGLLELWVDADLGVLAGWKGLSFHANGYQIHGTSITAESIGGLAPVSYIEAEPSTRLFELWFEQALFGGAATVRFGQLAADSEFIISDGAAAFINGTWGWPTIAAGNIAEGGPAFPLAAPGARIAINPEGDAGIMAAVYSGEVARNCPVGDNPQDCNPSGLDFPFGDGALLMTEGFYKYNVASLPGRIKLGGWLHTGDVAEIENPEIVRSTNEAVYAVWDQVVHRFAGERHVDLFARVIGSPSNRNEIDLYAEAGIVIIGPSASRPRDMIGLGYAVTRISDSVRSSAIAAGETIIPKEEGVLELSYTAEIVPGFTVQPDLQYIWNPGGRVADDSGTRAVQDALVFGLRTTMNW